MNRNQTESQVGQRIGRAIARDVLAWNWPCEWTGIDPQDGDQIPEGMDFDRVQEFARVEYQRYVSEAVR